MGHQSEVKNRILGYSERGIINSLIFSIGDDNELMDAFISLIKIPEIEALKNTPKEYTILLEQSFSRFGDCDLVIIIEYENPKHKKVLFIEGKVKTSNSSWNIQSQFNKYVNFREVEKEKKPKDYWSVLFSQLYLKKLLIDKWDKIKYDEEFVIKTPLLGIRKIGTNKVVKKAVDLIECSQAFYVGLIPTSENKIKTFKESVNYIKNMDFEMHYLAWETVENFCLKHENPNGHEELIHPKLKKVIAIFNYNKGQIY
jgi:hypothetical protein